MKSPLILDSNNVPEWHISIVRERIKSFTENSEQAIDFDLAMDEIQVSLNSSVENSNTENSG